MRCHPAPALFHADFFVIYLGRWSSRNWLTIRNGLSLLRGTKRKDSGCNRMKGKTKGPAAVFVCLYRYVPVIEYRNIDADHIRQVRTQTAELLKQMKPLGNVMLLGAQTLRQLASKLT